MRAASRVALNSVALYTNMIVSMGAALLGTRFVLQALGSTEYGAYALIANIVAMFSFINVAMSVATQRYISFAIGSGEAGRVKEVFYNNVVIHICIASILALFLVAVGIPAIECWLDIPREIHGVALVVLLCMIVGIVFIVVSVPYEGMMNAKEDIVVIAGINIVDALFKFLAAVVVLHLNSRRLIVYAALVMCSSIIAFTLKKMYCHSHYAETCFRWHRVKDFSLVRSMIGFAGWNLIGAGSSLARYQGVAVLLNKFFGLAANAAYGISQQLNGFLVFFANSSVRPMRPQIVKHEAAGMHSQMVKLASTTSKFSFVLLSLVVVPLYVNMPYVIDLWLVEIPAGVLEFCRGFLIIVLIGQLSIGLQIALESVGRIKLQQIIVGLMHLLPLPAAYILFNQGYSAHVIMYCIIAEEVIALLLRVLIARIDADMPIESYAKEVIFPCVALAAVAFLSAGLLDLFVASWHPMARLILTTLFSVTMIVLGGYFFCFSAWEKGNVNLLLAAIMRRFKVKKRN